MAKNDLTVFITRRESHCDECDADLGRHAWITLQEDKGALCLFCADLDHLIFLPAGDAALTRRSRKYSTLAAVVLEWSRTRKRYERQGLLVEEAALHQAEAECLADADVRARRRERNAIRRAELNQQYVAQFTQQVRELYPGCPPGRGQEIAEHACRKYSGRVGQLSASDHRLPFTVHRFLPKHLIIILLPGQGMHIHQTNAAQEGFELGHIAVAAGEQLGFPPPAAGNEEDATGLQDAHHFPHGRHIRREKFQRFQTGDGVESVRGKGQAVGGLLDEGGATTVRV